MIVLLHGVGFGPGTMTAVTAAVPGSVVVPRPPVRGDLWSHAEDVASVIASSVGGDRPYVVAGVSGGATLALALAVVTGGAVAGVVAHEPLLGAHAPALWSAVTTGHRRLAAGALDPAGWYAGLVGADAWAMLDADVRAAVLHRHPDLLAEITPFVTWDPSLDQLGPLASVPIRTTVGHRSPAARHEAATALADLTGATVEVLPGCGHLAQLDAPRAFAASINAFAGAAIADAIATEVAS